MTIKYLTDFDNLLLGLGNLGEETKYRKENMFINLTPHAIHLPNQTIEPSGQIARCTEVSESVGEIDGIEIITRVYGEVTGLPDTNSENDYIVSAMVRLALPLRYDILSPGDLIRDDKGQIVGARNLVQNR